MARPPRTEFGAARRRAPMTSGISRGSYGTWAMPASAPRVACTTIARRRQSWTRRAMAYKWSAEVDTAQTAYLGHPTLGEPVGGDRRRHPLVVGEAQDLPGGVEDLGGPQLGALEVEALDLVGHLDHAAGVDHVVGRVEDAAFLEELLDARVGELVVGTAGDHLGAQGGHGVVVERAAEGAGRVDVDIG